MEENPEVPKRRSVATLQEGVSDCTGRPIPEAERNRILKELGKRERVRERKPESALPTSPKGCIARRVEVEELLLSALRWWAPPNGQRVDAILQTLPESDREFLGAFLHKVNRCIYHAYHQVLERYPEQRRGRKVLEGAKAGQRQTYGTFSENLERWETYFKDVEKKKREHPKLSNCRVYELVAQRYGVCPKTVERAYLRLVSRRRT